MLLTKHRENLTLFERLLQEYGILYCRIRPAMPRHSGKLERSNRTDDLRFYSKLRMFSLPDGQKQLAVYQRKSSNYDLSEDAFAQRNCRGLSGAVLMANGLPVLSARQAPLSIILSFSPDRQGRVVFAAQISTLPLAALPFSSFLVFL